ncbi:MAG TPA: CocE/NonD family hydrolase, partial [Actinoplanes sp.]
MAVRRSLLSALLLTLTIAATPQAAHASPVTAAVRAEVAAAAVPITGLRLLDIRSHDGVVLKANLIAPTTPGPHPAIVFVNSWGLNDAEYLAQSKILARKGYVVLSYTTRGFWGSGGRIDTAGPADIADVSSMIDWLVANTAADPARIGMGGVSYGAGIGLIAAANDPRIRAVTALSGWTDMYESLFGGDTRRPQALWLLNSVAKLLGRTTAEFDAIYADYFGGRNVPGLKTWADLRSAETYLPALRVNKPALLLANAYGDSLFAPNQLADFFAGYDGPKRLELSAGDHAIPEITGLIGLPNHVWTSVGRWFDHYLAGIDTGVDDEPVVLRVRNSGAIESYADWADVTGATVRYHLGDAERQFTGPMQATPAAAYRKTFRATGDTVAGAGVVLLTNGLEALTGTPPTDWLPQVNRNRAAVWQSPVLRDGAALRGIARMHLALTPGAAKGTVVAYLYDMDSRGYGKLVAHTPVSWSQATPGAPLPLDLALPATAWDVAAGHRLALVVDTQDPLYLDDNA